MVYLAGLKFIMNISFSIFILHFHRDAKSQSSIIVNFWPIFICLFFSSSHFELFNAIKAIRLCVDILIVSYKRDRERELLGYNKSVMERARKLA